jgi:acyl-homoserine lactone acylase PvdQ
MQAGQMLFGSPVPKVDSDKVYSHMWGGMSAGENYMQLVEGIANGNGVKETIEMATSFEKGFKGVPQNFIMADNSGDIGYVMVNSIPNRKDKTPYIGNRVLNGETTDYDWDGYIPSSELPWTINPDRGYIVTANNRQMPDHCANDIGATFSSTTRAIRLDEMIREWIKDGHKITVEDMSSMQQDDTDVMAREFAPKMVKIAQKVID